MKGNEGLPGEKGLLPPWYREDGIKAVHGAFRPMDPLLKDRLRELGEEVEGLGIREPGVIALAIRSISGFYCTLREISPAQLGKEDMVDVIDFDPARRWMIVSGTGDVDPLVEVFWYGTRAFPDDMVYCIYSTDAGKLPRFKNEGRSRIEEMLTVIRRWKDSSVVKIEGATFWRGRDLDALSKFLTGELTNPKDQRSQ